MHTLQSLPVHQDSGKVRGAYPTARVGWVGDFAETRLTLLRAPVLGAANGIIKCEE